MFNIITNIRMAYVVCMVSSMITMPAISEGSSRPSKVFLLGGQSNMVGEGLARDLKKKYTKSPENVKLWSKGKWAPLAPDSRGKFGPEIAFGHEMAKALPNDDIYLVKYAYSGTALYNDWAPGTGPQYRIFMVTAKAALADLEKSKNDYTIDGFLWLQGESDANEGKGNLYEENLKAFIDDMRSQFKVPHMPFIIARVLDFFGSATGHAKMVRDAQVKIAESASDIAWINTDDCKLQYAGHYGASGVILIGERFAKSYQKMMVKTNGKSAAKTSSLRRLSHQNKLAKDDTRDTRVWKARNGDSIKASIIEEKGTLIALKKEDGSIVKIPKRSLSSADQTYIKELIKTENENSSSQE